MSAAMAGQNLFADNFRRPLRMPTGPAGFNEEQSTNLIFPSAPSSLGGLNWAPTNSTTISPATVPAPDGSMTAALLAANTTANDIRGTNNAVAPCSAGVTYTVSIYARTTSIANCYFQLNAGGAVTGYFNLTTGTGVVGADLGAGITYKSVAVTPAGNGWYRLAFTLTASAGGALAFYVGPCTTVSATGDNRSAVGVVGQGIYVWGAQIEQGNAASSYIATLAASATRQGATVDPPDQGNIPAVATATGLGNGGASIAGGSDSANGIVHVWPGIGAAASGTITLRWPIAVPAAAQGVFVAADWATLAVTQGNPLTIAWTAPAALKANSRPHRIAYQWNVVN